MTMEAFDWADFLDENNYIRVKSVNFGDCLLEQLEREYASSLYSLEAELDRYMYAESSSLSHSAYNWKAASQNLDSRRFSKLSSRKLRGVPAARRKLAPAQKVLTIPQTTLKSGSQSLFKSASLSAAEKMKQRKVRKRPNTNSLGKLIVLSESQIKKRLVQIQLGLKTPGYKNYAKMIPKHKRSQSHPRTPDARERISKRRFDGKVRSWRRKLHQWDEPLCTENVPPLKLSSPVKSDHQINIFSRQEKAKREWNKPTQLAGAEGNKLHNYKFNAELGLEVNSEKFDICDVDKGQIRKVYE